MFREITIGTKSVGQTGEIWPGFQLNARKIQYTIYTIYINIYLLIVLSQVWPQLGKSLFFAYNMANVLDVGWSQPWSLFSSCCGYSATFFGCTCVFRLPPVLNPGSLNYAKDISIALLVMFGSVWIWFLCVLIKMPKIKNTRPVQRNRAIFKPRKVSNEYDSK